MDKVSIDNVVSIPYQLTYLLPAPFDGDIFEGFVSATQTSDTSVNELFRRAKLSPFISYDDEFRDLVGGPSTEIKLIEERQENFAGEAGVWIKDRNEVWYTTWINDGPTHVEILSLETNQVRRLIPSERLQNPNGGYYYRGKVYFTCLRSDSMGWPGGVVSVDPETGHVETVLNSYFGLKFDNVDDLVWVTSRSTGESFMFLTILPYPDNTVTDNTLPAGLWRWDPQRCLLLPAISHTELPVANGVRVCKDQKTLWVTDFGGAERSKIWGLPGKVGAPAIYKFDLSEECWPVNKRIFGIARMQAPDGIRIDDMGRVWTAEGEGIVVRSSEGKILGLFNAYFFTKDPKSTAIVQFELAGNTVVVLGQNKLWTVKLNHNVHQGIETAHN